VLYRSTVAVGEGRGEGGVGCLFVRGRWLSAGTQKAADDCILAVSLRR